MTATEIPVDNGVNVEALLGVRNALGDTPEIARFQWRSTVSWINGTHVVLERAEVANSWRTQRWDSLRLLTPDWMTRLPGYAYHGADPDGARRTSARKPRHLSGRTRQSDRTVAAVRWLYAPPFRGSGTG